MRKGVVGVGVSGTLDTAGARRCARGEREGKHSGFFRAALVKPPGPAPESRASAGGRQLIIIAATSLDRGGGFAVHAARPFRAPPRAVAAAAACVSGLPLPPETLASGRNEAKRAARLPSASPVREHPRWLPRPCIGSCVPHTHTPPPPLERGRTPLAPRRPSLRLGRPAGSDASRPGCCVARATALLLHSSILLARRRRPFWRALSKKEQRGKSSRKARRRPAVVALAPAGQRGAPSSKAGPHCVPACRPHPPLFSLFARQLWRRGPPLVLVL